MTHPNWPEKLVNKLNEALTNIDFSDATPSKENVLKFLEQNPRDIKVVIVGQDPYPTKGVANGNAFAVNSDVNIPGSLRNIFKEIKEVQGFVMADKTLKHWTQQGVLLLNRSLTTKIGLPNAHKSHWHHLTLATICWLDQEVQPIFVLWGNDAKLLTSEIKHSQVIIDAHPSPLSFSRRKKNTFREIKSIKW